MPPDGACILTVLKAAPILNWRFTFRSLCKNDARIILFNQRLFIRARSNSLGLTLSVFTHRVYAILIEIAH